MQMQRAHKAVRLLADQQTCPICVESVDGNWAQYYARAEREMLAIIFRLERFKQYVYGRHTGVETYREPLIPIHKKTAADATQNTKMRV